MAGFAPQDSSWRQRVCSARRLTLLLMGLLAVVTLSITLFGFVGRKYSTALWKMQEDLKAMNRTIAAELAALQQNETNNVETLQRVNQLVIRVREEKREVKSRFQDQIKKLQGTLERLNCDLENAKHSRAGREGGCCPQGWHLFQQSCYWLSFGANTWYNAQKDCEEKEAHLVVISSYLESQFVFRLTKPKSVWIGLRFDGRAWKWVDGTLYTVHGTDWQPNEPRNYVQFCTMIYRDGLWSEIYCQNNCMWMCEMQALQ